jgi:carboxymethylenebutenolidase
MDALMKLNHYGLKPLDFQATNGQQATNTLASESNQLSRRGFLVTSLATGFALASTPLMAQAITTSSRGLVAGEVSVPVTGGHIPAYRAMPSKPGKHPTIVVIQEIFGVHEHIKDICRRLAKMGYYAIAPELFARQGDVSKMTDIGEILSQVVAKVPDAQVFADIDASIAFAKASGHADTKKLGTLGFCYGGRMVWLYNQHNPRVKAGIAYYGLLSGLKSEIKANDPIDIAASLKVPTLGLYAGSDSFIPDAMVDQMRAELQKSSSGSEIVVFPGLNHGFNADYRPTYDKAAADYAWKLASDWLKARGV